MPKQRRLHQSICSLTALPSEIRRSVVRRRLLARSKQALEPRTPWPKPRRHLVLTKIGGTQRAVRCQAFEFMRRDWPISAIPDFAVPLRHVVSPPRGPPSGSLLLTDWGQSNSARTRPCKQSKFLGNSRTARSEYPDRNMLPERAGDSKQREFFLAHSDTDPRGRPANRLNATLGMRSEPPVTHEQWRACRGLFAFPERAVRV